MTYPFSLICKKSTWLRLASCNSLFEDKGNKSWEKGNWESQKQKEKKRDSILDGVPISLPALLKARRIQEKAASVGFDWDNNTQVLKKVYGKKTLKINLSEHFLHT